MQVPPVWYFRLVQNTLCCNGRIPNRIEAPYIVVIKLLISFAIFLPLDLQPCETGWCDLFTLAVRSYGSGMTEVVFHIIDGDIVPCLQIQRKSACGLPKIFVSTSNDRGEPFQDEPSHSTVIHSFVQTWDEDSASREGFLYELCIQEIAYRLVELVKNPLRYRLVVVLMDPMLDQVLHSDHECIVLNTCSGTKPSVLQSCEAYEDRLPLIQWQR